MFDGDEVDAIPTVLSSTSKISVLIVVNVPLTTKSLATVSELPIVTLPSTVKS